VKRTLLDEVPPAGSVPVLGLLRIHRHDGHAREARNHAWTGADEPFGTFVLEVTTIARAYQSGEFSAQPLV
jgi:hypothetical protein